MSKLTAIGMVSLVSGLAMLIFKAISSLTSVQIAFPDLTLEDIVSPDSLEWIDTMSSGLMQNIASGAVTTPLYMFCIGLGIILLVISGLVSK